MPAASAFRHMCGRNALLAAFLCLRPVTQARGFIAKPYQLQSMLQMVREVLDQTDEIR
jgi:hypothetical protein